MTATIIRPPVTPTREHLFLPLVWVKPRDGEWVVEIEWAGEWSYSFDHDGDVTIDEEDEVGPDLDTANEVLCQLLDSGSLPHGDAVTSLPWIEFNPDPMEYFA